MNRVQKIQHLLQQHLQPSHLQVIDNHADHIGHANEGAGHYTVEIASPLFAGKSRVQAHQLVYQALATIAPEEIHALAIKITGSNKCIS